jgi:hypothetical protein
MPSPFGEPRRARHRHHHRSHSRSRESVAVETKPDYLVLGIWIALFVLFAIGALAALLR